MNYTEWAQQELSSLPNTKTAYLYKQQVIARMTERANELVKMGLNDNKVINELIKDEFKNIKHEFYSSQKKKEEKNKKKTFGKLGVLGFIAAILLLVIFYLAVSFITGLWGKTWLILVCGILGAAGAGMIFSSGKLGSGKLIYNFSSRVLMAGAIMIFATVFFLIATFVFALPKAWMIFLLGVVGMLGADCAMAVAAKQKTAIFTCLVYVPVIASLLYVTTGLVGIIPWHPGWIIIVLSLVADIGIAAVRVVKNSQKGMEEEVWEEN